MLKHENGVPGGECDDWGSVVFFWGLFVLGLVPAAKVAEELRRRDACPVVSCLLLQLLFLLLVVASLFTVCCWHFCAFVPRAYMSRPSLYLPALRASVQASARERMQARRTLV